MERESDKELPLTPEAISYRMEWARQCIVSFAGPLYPDTAAQIDEIERLAISALSHEATPAKGETPRTDAALDELADDQRGAVHYNGGTFIDHARQLERELNAWRIGAYTEQDRALRCENVRTRVLGVDADSVPSSIVVAPTKPYVPVHGDVIEELASMCGWTPLSSRPMEAYLKDAVERHVCSGESSPSSIAAIPEANEFAALVKDAERYRWLRQDSKDADIEERKATIIQVYHGAACDELIDKARAS